MQCNAFKREVEAYSLSHLWGNTTFIYIHVPVWLTVTDSIYYIASTHSVFVHDFQVCGGKLCAGDTETEQNTPCVLGCVCTQLRQLAHITKSDYFNMMYLYSLTN